MRQLTQHLSLLENRGLVRTTLERATPIVRFKHALTREATYNSMLQVRRAELHRAAAQTLTALYPQPDLEMVLTIADHWQRGSEDGAALQTVLPHAQRLIFTGRGSSLTVLLTHLERENLVPTQQRDLDIALADAYTGRGEHKRSLELYQSALALADTPALHMRVLHGIGTSEYHLGNFARVIEIQESHLELARRAHDLIEQARASSGIGAAFIGLGAYERAAGYFETSRALSLQAGHEQELANAEANLAVAFYNRGQFQQAIEAAEHALALDEKNGTQVYNARNGLLLGASYFGMEYYDRAEHYYLQALEASRALGDQLGAALGLTNLAELFGKRSELVRAADTYTQAIGLLESLNQDVILCFALTQLAELLRLCATQAADSTTFHAHLSSAEQRAHQAIQIAQRLSLHDQVNAASEILVTIHQTHFLDPLIKGA